MDANFYTADTISILMGFEPVTENQRIVQLAMSQCVGHYRELTLSPFQAVQLDQFGLEDRTIFELADPVCWLVVKINSSHLIAFSF